MVGDKNKEYKIFKFLSLIVSSVLKYKINWIEMKTKYFIAKIKLED